MKGISPVIATVLLLLMAVAAVGGSWVWYQRQSTMLGGMTEEAIVEGAESQTGVLISLADIFVNSNDRIGLIVNNGATIAVDISGYTITSDLDTFVNTSMTAKTVSASSTDQLITIANCTSGESVTVQLYAAGTNTQVFDEVCP